jgi:hypothetical protein
MKSKFREYYPLTEKELKKLWENAIFITDTNVLLNLYRYSYSTSKELLGILEKLNGRLWIPHQVGMEFHEHRLETIEEQTNLYEQITKVIAQQSQSFKQPFQHQFTRHPFIDNKKIISLLEENQHKLQQYLEKCKIKHPKWINKDPILTKITKLFKSNVGKEYTDEELEDLYKQGERRYAHKIPPGYKDLIKDQQDESKVKKFGDLVLWDQIMRYAKESKKPIIFITDDQKEDWWRIVHGKNMGPREELRKEIWEKARVEFHMYQTTQFISYAKDELSVTVTQETIKEIEDLKSLKTDQGQVLEVLKQETISLEESTEIDALSATNSSTAVGTASFGNLTNKTRKSSPNIDTLKEKGK